MRRLRASRSCKGLGGRLEEKRAFYFSFSAHFMTSSSDTALKTFSLTNDVLEVSPQDEIYRYDKEENTRINREAPWSNECGVPPPPAYRRSTC